MPNAKAAFIELGIYNSGGRGGEGGGGRGGEGGGGRGGETEGVNLPLPVPSNPGSRLIFVVSRLFASFL